MPVYFALPASFVSARGDLGRDEPAIDDVRERFHVALAVAENEPLFRLSPASTLSAR